MTESGCAPSEHAESQRSEIKEKKTSEQIS
jgi:hypothetical protein